MPGPRLNEDQVIDARRRYREGVTLTKLCADLRMGRENVRRMLIGETYGYIEKYKTPRADIRYEIKRVIAPEVVLFMRLTYQWSPSVSTLKLAKTHGICQKTVLAMLTGKTYAEVPEAIEQLRPAGNIPVLTDEQVIYCRRMYRTRQISAKALGLEFGLNRGATLQMIRGLSYKHLPGAVPSHICVQRRGVKHGPYKKRRSTAGPSRPVESTADSVSA